MRQQIRLIRFGLLTIITSTLLTSCQLGRFVFYNFADIKDHKKFQSRPLTADTSSFNFQSINNGKFPKQLNDIPFDKYLADNKTVAFLIIKNDTIQYEKYFKGYDKESIVPSFSMAKSVTSILIGCAIDEGLIKSVDEPITNNNFIVIVPEFSEANFPGGDQYNLGNVYVDGDNPTANTLNPESEWAFSVIEPLFDYVKTQLGNTNNTYKIFGHSAGAQFAHRFLMFKPNNRAVKTVLSAAGWYTFPDLTIGFPYGFNNSILQNSSRDIFLSKIITVQIGENDNNPNASGLRRNEIVDMQGTNRLDRAVNFFDFCEQSAQALNIDFNWSFSLRPNANHDYTSAAQDAAIILFD